MSRHIQTDIRLAQRDANLGEIVADLGKITRAPSRFKADETREVLYRAVLMIRVLWRENKRLRQVIQDVIAVDSDAWYRDDLHKALEEV